MRKAASRATPLVCQPTLGGGAVEGRGRATYFHDVRRNCGGIAIAGYAMYWAKCTYK